MSNESFGKIFFEKIISDYRNHLLLYKKLEKEDQKMIGLGLIDTVEYRKIFELHMEQRYFLIYLKKIIEYVSRMSKQYIENFFSRKSLIIDRVKVWKKCDIRVVRKLRKKHGNDSVEVMKKIINDSFYKIQKYIDSLEEEIKETLNGNKSD